MNSDHLNDRQLLDDVIETMRDVRARAPQDFLALLAIGLGILLIAITLIALLLEDEFLKSTLLNLSAEIFGAWLTVVLIDGLWRRLQSGSLAEYDVMARELERRKATPLTEEERQAWSLVINLYRYCNREIQSKNIIRYLRAVFLSWRRTRQFEAQGNQVLTKFARQVKTQVEAEQHNTPAAEGDELSALRNEVVRLRELIEQQANLRTQ